MQSPNNSSMPRIQSFDLARGFTVLMMPVIHVCMMYSTPDVQQSLLGAILTFIAEGPGAQLFMLLMGVAFTLSRNTSPGKILQRSFMLLIAAYLLNYVKFVIPLAFDGMPEKLLTELQLPNDFRAAGFFLLLGDILHFAAIAQVVLLVVSKLKHCAIIAIILAVAIIFTSPTLWDLQTGISAIDYLLNMFGGHPPQVFFPVFPWIVYPLLGIAIGQFITKDNVGSILKRLALVGAVLIIISLGLPSTTPNTVYLDFYRTRPTDTIFHIGIVLLWLQLFHGLSGKIMSNPIFILLTFCSKHITVIYILQWILICWCMAFTGYMELSFFPTALWMIGITGATLLFTYIYHKYAHRKSI